MKQTYSTRFGLISLVLIASMSVIALRTTSGGQPEVVAESLSSVDSEKGCEGCGDEFPKLEGRRTGIPEIDAEIVAENQRGIAVYARARDERIRADYKKRRDIWQGSSVDIPMYDPNDEWIYRQEIETNPKFIIPPK